ncbi:hypothetical protein A3Q34_02460 [Colwellia sp. PAMC 20917]|uniref:response regulator n=1 Tax=Colwellia sp. PAMC 20917 TaxID=1816218 RepID=UPI000878FB9B|nr:response regulator [Colwellia sp. PAMC 20917]AOW75817.1 hypothetical protein A3Q34_02460 [Colwellia sp. PAMC 20917]
MSTIKILAVDDQISSLLALEDVLSGINASIIKATSAREALLIMLKESIDCVLLDVSMPEMDGFEFLKTLRNAPTHTKVPVIMITGKIFSENETLRAYKYGAVDFLLKPIEPETLYRKVDFIVQQALRIKSIEQIEGHLKKLEVDLIDPIEALIANKNNSPDQKETLLKVSSKLKNLQTVWMEINNGK